MANRQIEIDVVVNTDQAEKGFDKLEEGSQAVGESFGSVGKAVSTLGGEANEALGGVGESVSGVVDGFGELISASKEGGMSFTAMAGPIGVAVVALFELIQAVREYSDETSGANIRSEAYIASTAELTSAIEELAAAQVKLNREQIKELRILSMQAKLPLEQAQMIREKNANLDKSIQLLKDEISQLEKNTTVTVNHTHALYAQSVAQMDLANRQDTLIKLRAKLAKKEAEADRLTQEGAKNFAKFEEKKEELLKQSPEFRKQILQQENKLLTDARLAELQGAKDSVKAQREIAEIGSRQKVADLRAIEDISEEVRSKAIAAERKRLQSEISSIEKSAAEKRRAEAEKRRNVMALQRARSEAQRLAQERQTQAELKQIRALEIESARINGATALEILNMRYAEELSLAEENANKILIAQKRYENQVTQIQKSEAAKREANEKQQAEQRANLIFDSMEFDANLIENQTQRELKLLELRYDRELQLNAHTQEEITELNRREAKERELILNESLNNSIDMMQDLGSRLAQDSLAAVYETLVDAGQYELQLEEIKFKFDQDISQTRKELLEAQRKGDVDSVLQREQEITAITQDFEAERRRIRAEEANATPLIFGNILKGLGKEAAVESLMQIAKGTAQAFTPGGQAAAAGHFKAAAIFAGAAAFAGMSGAALTNRAAGNISAAGRSDGNLGTSPTGSPQTAAAPERERAEETAMVFNINFDGAVIYDTQRAAEQALADRITNLQNTRRRGAPRRAF